MIVNAQLCLHSLSDKASTVTVGAYQVMDTTWSSRDVTWETQPVYHDEPEDYTTFDLSETDWVSFNITTMTKYWYEKNSNGGVMLRSLKEDGQYVEYVSADYALEYSFARPMVQITYINNSGLEDYWAYHQQSAGRAGTGYVNDYNGNLVFLHQTAATSGSRMPLTLTHVYNTNDKDTNLGYGYGWRLNYQQTIKFKDLESGDRYEYVDEDGTRHYFAQDKDGNWKDESGIDLELTIHNGSSEKYVINDKQDNKLIFDTSGKLVKISDRNGNTLSITYDSNEKITKITDGVGRAASCTYNLYGLLEKVTDPYGEKRFAYDANSRLTKVIYEDNKYATYSYNDHGVLEKAQDIDGYSIKYGYQAYEPYRVSSVLESSGEQTGQSVEISRYDNVTRFTDHKGRVEDHVFNDLGHTISIQNDKGYAQSSKYITQDTNKNKISKVSKLQSTVINQLKNANLESSWNWTPAQINATAVREADSSNAYE